MAGEGAHESAVGPADSWRHRGARGATRAVPERPATRAPAGSSGARVSRGRVRGYSERVPVQTPVRTPVEAPVKVPAERREHDVPWNVIVWNDPVTLMSYVVLVLRRLFGYDVETATRLMLQVHQEGRAVVASQRREQAEVSVTRLHAFGLQATLARG